MAKIDREVAGLPIQEWLAQRPDVHLVIAEHTAKVGREATRLKAEHVDEGHAFIETELADVDGWVILNDDRGKKAAMAMEFGSDPHPGFPEGTPAQLILHRASGIPVKATMPRSRRRKLFFKPKKRRRRRRS